jgi:hypothetical protein
MNLATRRQVQRAVLAFCCCIPVPLIAVPCSEVSAALEIGDILSPGGQAAEKKAGWKLRPFDDVRLAGR